jgi:hypothetical protein
MKPTHSPLRTTPPNLERLNKLERWTEEPLRAALGEGAEQPQDGPVAPEPPAVPAAPVQAVSGPETAEDDDLSWVPPRKRVAKQSYPLNLPADLHAKMKKLSEKTGESLNAMLVRGAEREYERIIAALKKK